jgi:hypothetical protein
MSNALSSLFRSDDSAPLADTFRVGTMTALSSVDGANTVTADGITYHDLPILFEGGGYGTLPSRVLLGKASGVPIVLGRLIIPGVPD